MVGVATEETNNCYLIKKYIYSSRSNNIAGPFLSERPQNEKFY